MLSTLLTQQSSPSFFESHFQKMPASEPKSALPAVGLFTWETLDRILRSGPEPDSLVVRNGELLERARPAAVEQVRENFAAGVSLVIRKGERHDAGLEAWALGFAQEVGGPATIQLFVTPAGTNSFGWHYDAEDVFIVQTAGVKEYFLRQNTVNPIPTVANMPKDLEYEKERTPTYSCTLIAGDWLYIPSGWWHMAKCTEDALSISTGVLSARAGAQTRP